MIIQSRMIQKSSNPGDPGRGVVTGMEEDARRWIETIFGGSDFCTKSVACLETTIIP
jgi:hypothetical protein